VTVARVDVDKRELDFRIVSREKRAGHKPVVSSKKERKAKQEKAKGKNKQKKGKRRR
jgi:hypothetical protein